MMTEKRPKRITCLCLGRTSRRGPESPKVRNWVQPAQLPKAPPPPSRPYLSLSPAPQIPLSELDPWSSGPSYLLISLSADIFTFKSLISRANLVSMLLISRISIHGNSTSCISSPLSLDTLSLYYSYSGSLISKRFASKPLISRPFICKPLFSRPLTFRPFKHLVLRPIYRNRELHTVLVGFH